MTLNKKILLVEDDAQIGLLLMDYFADPKYQMIWKRDGLSALDAVTKQMFDVCLLDVNMPGMDGFSLAKQIKNRFSELPFIFITARSLKEDKLKGYQLGAEDYILKPFDPDELECKMDVILRRTNHRASTPDQYKLGSYVFNTKQMELVSTHNTVKLTEKENLILQMFCNQINSVIRREDAVKQVYGKFDYFLGRSIDVFITRLRKLLKDDPGVKIENIYKVGFMLRVKE